MGNLNEKWDACCTYGSIISNPEIVAPRNENSLFSTVFDLHHHKISSKVVLATLLSENAMTATGNQDSVITIVSTFQCIIVV